MPSINLPPPTSLLTALAPFAWIAFHVWRERRRVPKRRNREQSVAVKPSSCRDL